MANKYEYKYECRKHANFVKKNCDEKHKMNGYDKQVASDITVVRRTDSGT